MRFRFSGIPLVCRLIGLVAAAIAGAWGLRQPASRTPSLPTGHKILARALPLRPGKALIHAGQATLG